MKLENFTESKIYIKKFELLESFREVDLQLLYEDYMKYRNKLGTTPLYGPIDMTKVIMIYEFKPKILEPLLIGKKIEFHRSQSPIDDEIRYGHWGIVEKIEEIILEQYNKKFKIIISLKNEKELFILTRIHAYIDKNSNNCNKIIKIYNSEELEIEKDINILKDTMKYNL